jgi:hypothetical protein
VRQAGAASLPGVTAPGRDEVQRRLQALFRSLTPALDSYIAERVADYMAHGEVLLPLDVIVESMRGRRQPMTDQQRAEATALARSLDPETAAYVAELLATIPRAP